MIGHVITDPGSWVALFTLTVMEIVLGIDNVVFISVLVAKLPKADAKRARVLGLMLAFVFRILMLVALTWTIGLTRPVLELLGKGLSWRDLILITGGLFLVWKATRELHRDIEEAGSDVSPSGVPKAFGAAIAQIAAIDFIFSIDSIVTAIGMVRDLVIMALAIIIAMLVMYAASGAIARVIRAHPTVKVLALAFLILIGVSLIADGWGFYMPRGYLYFTMAFAAAIEGYNVWAGKRRRGS